MSELYFFLNEQPSFNYTVSVTPAPADTSEVIVFKHAVNGEELARDELKKEGTDAYQLDLSARALEDSPLWLQFRFEKEDAAVVERQLAISLAKAVPGALEAPAEAAPGSHEVSVSGWGAEAYDSPDGTNFFPAGSSGPTDDRVSADAKADVKWRLGEEDLSVTGEQVQVEIPEDKKGTTVVVEAYRGDTAPGHAQASIHVPLLRVRGLEEYVPPPGADDDAGAADGDAAGGEAAEEGPPSAHFDPPPQVELGEKATLVAELLPAGIEGRYAWITEPQSDKVTLTPNDDGTQCEVEGVSITEGDEKIKVKAKFTSTATTTEYEGEHEFKVAPKVLEFFYVSAPGVNGKGVEGLEYKVTSPGGTELQTGTTAADGKIELKFGGDDTKLEIVAGGSPVAEYTVTRRTDAATYEAVTTINGFQRRLRTLGYQLGTAGTDGVGVDNDHGPITDRATLAYQADKNRNFSGNRNSGTRGNLRTDAGA